MTIYRIDVPLWATAYIRADSPEEALKRLPELHHPLLAHDEGEGGVGEWVFDDEDMPDVSFAESTTIADKASEITVDQVEDAES